MNWIVRRFLVLGIFPDEAVKNSSIHNIIVVTVGGL